MYKKIQIGLDLTKIKKFDKFINESKIDITKSELKKTNYKIGLDLVNNKSGYKIDLSKYGKDIN